MSDLLKEAIAGLGINVPIYHTVKQADGSLILTLYGGRIERWPPLATAGSDVEPDPDTTLPTLETAGSVDAPDPGTKPGLTLKPYITTRPTLATQDPELQDPPVTTDDFTAMPYVGKATAAALHKAGFHTFKDLIRATDTQLLDVPKINSYVLAKIRSYLYIHFS